MNRVLFVKTHVDGYVRRDTGQPVALDSSPVRSDEPTPAQAESGNYAKRVLPWKGLTIRIENEAGSVRRGTDPNGQAWESRMAHPYGYVVGSMGVDGDPVDVYVGPFAETAKQVFVVHQRRVGDWKKYDEDKVFIGMLNEEDVKAAFLQCYDDPRFLGPITAMPVDEFVAKVKATRTAPRMIKARVGPYIRLGKLVNIHGYDGRQARSGAAAGQASLFSEEDAPAPRPKKADLARHDHTNQADLFATEGEYHGIETRPGTEQAQIDAGEAALRDFSRHLFGVRADREQAPSILGARLYKGFTESGGAKLIGQRCATPADLAAIAQVYRDPRFETFRAVFVRDGEVVGESAYSSRMPGAVYLPDGVHNEIGRDGEAFGADGFYIVHNHPSGSAQPSQADIRVTVTAAELVAGFLGHVVIDHKEYASIEADGAYQVIQEPALTGTDFHSSPTLEHALLGSRVSSPKDVALVAKALQANGELENPVLVLTKGQNSEVELLTSFPKSLLPAPKSHKAAVKAKAWLRRVGRRTGAGALAFLVVSEKHMQDRFTLESLIRSGVVTDVVDSTGFSLRQSGIHPASGDGLWETSRRAQRVLFAKPAAPVRQTDTPQFREWFGSSKVRDENGEPMRMYHITPHDFDTFHPGGKEVLDGHPKGQSGRAIWFSPDKEEQPAAHNTRTRSGYQPGTNVMPVYLRIERPLLIDSETMMEWARNAFGEGSSMFPQIMLSKWVDAVKEGGYDGIIFKGKDLGWGQNGDEYIAFEPEQIKSAIGNNGDFSKESPVITKSTQAAADRRPILFLKAKLRTDDRTIDMFSTHLETKTRKDGVVQKYRVANAKPATVTEPRAEMVKEHERLVRVLESPSHEDDKAEAKRQKKELEEYKEGGDAPSIQDQIAAAKRRLSSAKDDGARSAIEKEIRELRRRALDDDPIEPAAPKVEATARKVISRADFEAMAAKHGEQYARGYRSMQEGYSMHPPSDVRKKADKAAWERGWMAANGDKIAADKPPTSDAHLDMVRYLGSDRDMDIRDLARFIDEYGQSNTEAPEYRSVRNAAAAINHLFGTGRLSGTPALEAMKRYQGEKARKLLADIAKVGADGSVQDMIDAFHAATKPAAPLVKAIVRIRT